MRRAVPTAHSPRPQPCASIISFTRRLISSRISRTRSAGWPFGSSIGQSSTLTPAKNGRSSPHPMLTRWPAVVARRSVQAARNRRRQIDASLAHGVEDVRFHGAGWFGAGRDRARAPRVGLLIEEGHGHLRATRVADAGKDDSTHGLPARCALRILGQNRNSTEPAIRWTATRRSAASCRCDALPMRGSNDRQFPAVV